MINSNNPTEEEPVGRVSRFAANPKYHRRVHFDPSRLQGQVPSTRALRMVKLMVRDPVGGFERVRGKFDAHRDIRELRALDCPPAGLFPAVENAHERLHELLGAPWPCPLHDEFDRVIADTESHFKEQVRTAEGQQDEITVQAARLADRFDADSSLARAAWCTVQHRGAATVVETGVARGITSRAILSGLERNGRGHLWSIDLPHADTTRFGQLGSAVPGRLRHRWTLLLGPSRRLLPQLLADLGQIDVFVHDSLHTGRNVRFECERAWRVLSSGGVILSDDVSLSLGFYSFLHSVEAADAAVGEHTDGGGFWGGIVKP